MSDAAEITATIKYSKDYDAPWMVAKGTPAQVRQQIIDYFGLTDIPDEATPHEVLLKGAEVAQAARAVQSRLNGRVDWPSSNDRPAPAKKSSSPKKKEEKDEDPNGNIIAQIELAETEDALKKIFALNKEAFKTDSVKAASQKRFTELKGNK